MNHYSPARLPRHFEGRNRHQASRLVRKGLGFAALAFIVGCETKDAPTTTSNAQTSSATNSGDASKLTGEVNIDGSSTVLPISAAMSEGFQGKQPGVQVPVTGSGTSSGFKRLIAGEIDIAGASRPIAEKEIADLKAQGRDYLELQMALDGLSVAVNKDNDWCSAMSVAQLRQLWKTGSTISKWNELNPAWPDAPIKLFGAGTNSGTWDYFTEAVNGKRGDSRSDYTQSEDDNHLVIGVSGDKYALGYFGYSYYDENRDKLKIIRISEGDDVAVAVEPSKETIESGTYKPLSRPLFMYINKAALKRPAVVEFLRFCLSDEGQALVQEAHCIRMNANQLAASRQRFEEALKGAGG
jgi:phosphate transport system substrate-binding protein